MLIHYADRLKLGDRISTRIVPHKSLFLFRKKSGCNHHNHLVSRKRPGAEAAARTDHVLPHSCLLGPCAVSDNR